jgi:site-specific recombinase XerC
VGDVAGKDRLVVDERIAEKGATGEVPLCTERKEILGRFLKLKRGWREPLEDDAPLFISRRNQRLSLRSFNDLMDKWEMRWAT